MTDERISQKVSQAVFECSPTQVATYELCPRKWAWSWLDGVEAPKSRFAEFGIKVHRHLELWLKKRLPPGGDAESRVAQVMLPHLPPPHLVESGNVEREVGLVLGDVRFVMAIDLFFLAEVPVVFDHKTTSSFDWALRPAAMRGDVQATLYAAWAMVSTRAPEVDVQWTYGQTRGAPRAMPVRARLSLPMIEDRVRRSVESAREMRAILEAGGSAMGVRYDASACEAFGGCPFQDKCNLTLQDRLTSVISQGGASQKEIIMSHESSKEEVLMKLRARRQNGATAEPAQVNPAPAEQPKPQSKLAARIAARAAAPAPAAPAPEPVPTQALAAAPDPQPAIPEPEEAPKRTRGRPAGSTSKPSPAEQWTAFAAVASSSMLAGLETADHLDAEVQEGVALAAGAYADAMLKEYLSRFGG